MVRTAVSFESDIYSGESLTSDELALLTENLKVMSQPDSLLRTIYEENFGRIRGAVEVAKVQLQASFTGMYAGDREIGIQHIRPFHLMRTTATTETVANTWSFVFPSGYTAAQGWVGFSTTNGTALNIDKRAVVLILALGWTQGGPPVVEELTWTINGKPYPTDVIRQGWFADNRSQIRMTRIRPKLLPGKATVLAQPSSLVAATNELVPVGLTIATGDLLRTANPLGGPQT